MTALTAADPKTRLARIDAVRREADWVREPGIGKHVFLGLLMIAVFVGGAGYWATSAQIDGAVVAPATFVVEGNRKTVQHLDGGIVRSLHVSDGDFVREGDLLVELDSTESDVESDVLAGQFGEIVVRRARLLAQIAGLDAFGEASAAARLNGLVVGDVWRLPYITQRQLFDAERNARRTERDVLDQRVLSLTMQIEGLEDQRAANTRQLEITGTELTALQSLFDKGLVAAPRLNAVRIEIERLIGVDANLRTRQAEARNQIGALRLTGLSQQNLRNEALSAELSAVEAQLASIEPRFLGALERGRRIEVVAPATGKIVNMAIHTAGGVIRPGQAILDIVPVDETLILQARVSPSDVDKLTIGQETRIRLSAFADADTPEAIGRILGISADSLEDERTGEMYFEAKVALADDQPEAVKRRKLLPGMPADLFFNTGERTAMEYLVQPLTDRLARSFVE